MRTILISLFLASAAASPAIAGPDDNWSDRQQVREERQQARQQQVQAREQVRAERPSFTSRMPQFEAQQGERFAQRPQFNGGARFQQQMNGGARFQQQMNGGARFQPQVDVDAMRAEREARRQSMATQTNERMQRVQQRFDQRQQEMRDLRDLRQSTRPVPNVMRNPHPLIVSDTPRPGTQPPLPSINRTTPTVQWNTNWRNNNHYDWRNYRRHHRSFFHLGFYYDPFGWGYFPYQIGWRMWPAYYGNRYWINDPWYYRLPYAPPGYVWIRYWNDALLVDTWSGEVVDMIPGFFW